VATTDGVVRREIKLDAHQTKGSKGRTVVLANRVRKEIEGYMTEAHFVSVHESGNGNFSDVASVVRDVRSWGVSSCYNAERHVNVAGQLGEAKDVFR
jgi:hypothetical protein